MDIQSDPELKSTWKLFYDQTNEDDVRNLIPDTSYWLTVGHLGQPLRHVNDFIVQVRKGSATLSDATYQLVVLKTLLQLASIGSKEQ